MEREELIQRLTAAYPFLEELENISVVCEQCENGFYGYERKKKTATKVWIITLIVGILMVIASFTNENSQFGAGIAFAGLLFIIAVVAIIVLIARKCCKKYKQEMQSFADKYNQYEEHFQKRLKEDGDLIDFIPDQYQSTFAVSYFLDVIRTGAAKDLNEAIQQLLIYSGNLQQQQAMADLAAQAQSMQNQLNAIRDEML